MTLTGSGRTIVTTASTFRPRQRVKLTGAVEATVRACRDGRITFTVDLGAPHTLEQYTPEQQAAEAVASPSYFTTKIVAFS